MVINKDYSFRLFEDYQIKLTDAVLSKIEDAVSHKKELLLTIAASHYGLKNGNGVIYRHDTVALDIPSFVAPRPRPIIEKHKPKDSEIFGHVIAADYKLTKFYDQLSRSYQLEDLDTDGYMALCRDALIPTQRRNPGYDGLAYVEVIGKLDNKEGIKRVLDGEFLTVSIGAGPRRLVCSVCGQDQVDKICEHFPLKKAPHIFMLAESLEYEELSFVNKPADPFGRITKIHDGIEEETTFERESNWLDATVDVIDIKDFFKQAEGKKIVCMDNICTIINQEEGQMAGTTKEKVAGKTVKSVALSDEFSAEQLQAIKLSDEEAVSALALSDDELTDKTFAVIQKTDSEIIRRFPMRNGVDIKAGLQLIDSAENLTEQEREKAKAALGRAAKKAGIELIADKVEEPEATEVVTEVPKITDIDEAIEALKDAIEAWEAPEQLEDARSDEAVANAKAQTRKNPIEQIFQLMKGFGTDLKWAGEAITSGLTDYLEDSEMSLVAKDSIAQKDALVTELTDKLAEGEKVVAALKTDIELKDEEIDMLDKQNVDLNYQLRINLVDEIVTSKNALGLIEDSCEDEKTRLMKKNYEFLTESAGEYRKLRGKLKDSLVNNNISIKTITDPTLADSEDPSLTSQDQKVADKIEDENKELSLHEKVASLQTLFTFIRR